MKKALIIGLLALVLLLSDCTCTNTNTAADGDACNYNHSDNHATGYTCWGGSGD